MGNLISDFAGGAIQGVLDSAGNLAVKIREAIKGKEIDPAIAAQITSHLDDLQQTLQQGQMQINLEEAKSEKWWKAGWRPFVGWVCGLGLFMQYIILPLLACFDIAPKKPLDFTQLIILLGGLLGFGTLRSYDKKQGLTQ